jgi:hypothetical protein
VHRQIIAPAAIVLAVLLVACSTTTSPEPDLDPTDTAAGDEASGPESNVPPLGEPAVPDEPAAPDEPDEPAEPAGPAVDPAEVGANELGEVPVLMYHKVLDSGGSEYDLTPEQFRGELQYLYDTGYRPIRTIDLVRGEIDIPAGTSPVVLTFDDSTREQFSVTPRTAPWTPARRSGSCSSSPTATTTSRPSLRCTWSRARCSAGAATERPCSPTSTTAASRSATTPMATTTSVA